MPPNTPIFADVASRLRQGHGSASEMASLAAGFETAATTLTTISRLPSNRPLDYRWGRSRGIILNNVKRKIHTDRTWKQRDGIHFAPQATRRSYATREIGASKIQKSNGKPATGSTSYLDNAHRMPGFGGSSPKQMEELSERVKELEADVSQKRQHIAKLHGSIESKDGMLAKHEREFKKSRQDIEQMKAAHKKEIEKLQRGARQEKDVRTLELHAAEKRHAQELQDVRDSAGLAEDAPILQEARSKGEKKARQQYDQQLRELKQQHDNQLRERDQQHELELKREKGLRIDLENWKQRTEREKGQEAGKEAAVIKDLRDDNYSLRRERNIARDEADQERKRNDRLRGDNADLQKVLQGRKVRTEEDRRDYFGYRELFHIMGDSVYEVLGGATSIREALEKESHLWQKSAVRFQQDKQLLFFRQQPKYNTLKRSINEFLEARVSEAQAAAARTHELSRKLLETRKSLNLQGHASRMVTRYLHFEKEPTQARGVSVAHYMSLVLPFTQRLDECRKQLVSVEAEIENLRARSSEIPVELQHEYGQLIDRKQMLSHYLKFAEAFRYQEAMAALSNSSLDDRITFVRMRSRRDRFNAIMEVANRAEGYGQSGMGTVRRQLSRAKSLLDQWEDFVRTRVIVQQDIGQLDAAVIKEADEELRRRLAAHKRDADMAIDVIAGQRTSLARNYKERKVELSRSTATPVSSSIDDLAASLKSGIKHVPLKPDVPRPGGSVVRRTGRSALSPARSRRLTFQSSLAHHRKIVAALRERAHDIEDVSSRALIKQKIEAEEKKFKEQYVDRKVTSGSSAKRGISKVSQVEQRDEDASEQKSQMDLGASTTTAGLNFTATQPMRAPHMIQSTELSKNETQVLRWATLSDALGCRIETASIHIPDSSSSSLHAVLKSQRSGKASSISKKNLVPAATPADQSLGEDALSRDASQTRAPSTSSTTTTSAEPPTSSSELQEFAMPVEEPSRQDDGVDIDATSLPSSLSSYVPSDSDGSESAASPPGSPPPRQRTEWTPEPPTVLDYQIPQKAYRDAVIASTSSNAAFWTHQLYKSSEGKSPVVYYCKNLETAERQCKLFLKEPVLGFDLEWEINASLHKSPVKKCVSLIQLASEDKICLIHVACFTGDKVDQLLPPTLKTILEDVKVVKAGVNISGDANRMRHCFGVDMKGVFELSHMYRLVKTPDQVSFKLVGLAAQVQNTLLLPLKKDDIRVSSWSKTLNAQQCTYAAADAYAGFRLFYQLDNLRKDLRPTPPRPAFFETYKPIILGDGTNIERASVRPKAGSRKGVTSGVADESDDEFFDALEDLPDTYELDGVQTFEDGKVDIDEADPESVAALREMMEKTSLEDSPVPANGKRSNDTKENATGNQVKPKPAKSAPHILVASPETILADMWVASLPSRNPKVGAASLRAYHLWHHQNHSLDAVAGLCRQPPLAMTSVASYIMTAVKEEDMPYDKERLKDAFVHLPKSVWHVYSKWVKELGLNM